MLPVRLAALLFAAALPGMAAATTVVFTYSGADPDDAFVTSSGIGAFSFAKDGAIGLADLTAFSFAFTVRSDDPALRYVDTFTYALADLTAFAATAQAGTVSALALRTGFQSPPDQYLAPEYLVVRSLNAGGLVSYFAPGDDAQHGTVRISAAAVPEPATWAAMTLGLGLVGASLRRRPARLLAA